MTKTNLFFNAMFFRPENEISNNVNTFEFLFELIYLLFLFIFFLRKKIQVPQVLRSAIRSLVTSA